jgi:hypothetical protein
MRKLTIPLLVLLFAGCAWLNSPKGKPAPHTAAGIASAR